VPAATPPRAAMTGLASRLEPAIVDAPVAVVAPGGKRMRLWLALAAAVLAGSAGVIVAMKKTGTPRAAAATTPGDPAKPAGAPRGVDASIAVPEWPEPLVPDGMKFEVDQRFDAPEAVRVLATRKRDAQHLARTYVATRSRFIDFADKRHVGAAVEIHPLNLAVVPQRVLCDPRLYAPPDAPSDKCADLRFYYEPRSRTLYVVDDDSTELVNLPEGAAVHLCRTTPALHAKGCGATLLNPYFDEIERDL
jgi:hypothetical protein